MSLEELRKQIDTIDTQLVELLNERARVVVEVGKRRSHGGPGGRLGEVFVQAAQTVGLLPGSGVDRVHLVQGLGERRRAVESGRGPMKPLAQVGDVLKPRLNPSSPA